MKHYLIAVSGGPDSMALLNKYRKKIQCVCHVNYKKRKSSDRDEKIVEKYCKVHNLKIRKLICNKKVYDKYKKISNNFERIAREIRYDFFNKCSKIFKNNNLLIAHNLDDFIETAIMQEKKKSKSLFYGIKKRNFYKSLNIFRPLINIRKNILTQYCQKHNIEFGIDETNFLDIYERNRIRKENANLTKKEFNLLVKKFMKLNKKNKSFCKQIDKKYLIWENTNFLLEYFTKQNERTKYYLLYNFMSKKNIFISGNKIKGILDFINSPKKGYFRLGEKIKLSKDKYLNSH